MSSGEPQQRTRWVRDAMERFEGRLMRYAARLTGNAETGREVVQETFLRLCREQPEKLKGHLEPWLFAVCRNRALDVAKQEKRMPSLTDSSAPNQQAPEPATNASPGAALVAQETSTELQAMLTQLSTNKQEVIRLKFQEGLSYQQISAVTGLSISNVGYLLHTALKELRTEMQQEE